MNQREREREKGQGRGKLDEPTAGDSNLLQQPFGILCRYREGRELLLGKNNLSRY